MYLLVAPLERSVGGFLSVVEYAQTCNMAIPSIMEILDSSGGWLEARERHHLVENLSDPQDPLLRRARVISWILFVLSMPDNEEFFCSPIVQESPHPYPFGWSTMKSIRRPGASALDVHVDSLRLTSGSRDTLSFYLPSGILYLHDRK